MKSDEIIPAAKPMLAPIAASFPLLPGIGMLDDRHPISDGLHPLGILVVSVSSEVPTECPINAPRPAPARGATMSALPRLEPGSLIAYPSVVSSTIGPGMGVT